MIRKLAGVLALITAGWLLLILLAVVFVEGSLWITGVLGLQHALGMDTQTTHNYASVSGVLPMVVAAFGFSGVLVTAWRRINCHTKGCPRIGKHQMAGGRFVICTPCLKAESGTPDRITREHIYAQHAEHVRRTGRSAS